jgi:transcriptional regulator with XRE-family HTH domain
VADSASGRACEGCGRPLSKHNPGNRCQACVSSARGKGTADKDNTRALACRDDALDDAPIGPRLAGLRRARGLTQEQLAESAGLSTDTVRKLEQGAKRWARLETLTALAGALNTSVGELVDPSSAQRHNEPPTDKHLPTWALRLTELRRARAWSAADLAHELKKRRDDLPSVRSLAHMIQMDWETGKHRPGPRYRLLLAAIHDANERQLFGDGDPGREAAAQAPQSQENTVRVPNLILRRIREQERHETRSEFAQALARTAREMGESLEPSERYVARLEDGDIRYPHPPYRRVLMALCGRPMSELGFAHDEQSGHFHDGHSDEHNISKQAEPEDVGQLPSGWSALLADIEDAMKRREFLLSLATSAGLGAVGISSALETMRHDVNLSLAEHHVTAEVEEWREIALEYGQTYPTTAPSELLQTLMVDLYGLRAAIGRYHDDVTQRELRRVGAVLSAFTAQTVANLGYLRDSRRWWRTARRAADESEDRYTMVWVRGREIVRAGYEHRPPTVILQLIEEAEARTGTTPPIGAMPELLGGKAQTLALLDQTAADDAENTLIRLRESFDSLPPQARGVGDSVFTWGEERLRFTESMVYTYLGEFRKADIAQTAALALNPRDDLRSPAQIELQRALCLVSSGDVLQGVRHAHSIIRNLPDAHRVRPVDDLGHKVLRAVPAAERHRAEVRDYHECLSLTAADPRTEIMTRKGEGTFSA